MDNKTQYTKTLQSTTTPTTSNYLANANNSNISSNLSNLTNFSDITITKNTIIIILLVVISLLLLGINVLHFVSEGVSQFVKFFSYLLGNLLAFFGYTTGRFINKTADVVNDGVKLTSDIVDGTAHSVGDILIHSSENSVNNNVKGDLDRLLNERHQLEQQHSKSENKKSEPHPDTTLSVIQNPISTKKTKWCFIGEYSGKRGCVEINENDKCLSGSVFPNKEECMK